MNKFDKIMLEEPQKEENLFVFVSEKQSDIKTRLLPPKKDNDPLFVSHSYHYLENQKTKCKELECPICQEYKASCRLGLNMHELRPVERWCYNAIVRGKEEEGPKIFLWEK